MALSLSQTEAVGRLVKPGMKVCSFGYPDVIAPVDFLMRETFASLEYRKDSEAICKRHGLKSHQIPDAHSFFKLLGAELDVFDIIQERGCEILLDLNQVLTESYGHKLYDIVLDVGTAEHCFNIGQALMNMAAMVKQGGWIIHENPANWGNHGFYNLNPTLFFDFYDQNGFEVQALKLVTRDGRYASTLPVQRFKFPNEEVNIFCIAQRIIGQKLAFPVQSKYKNMVPPTIQGERAADDRAIRSSNG